MVAALTVVVLMAAGSGSASAGSGWQIVASPDFPQVAGAALSGVACSSATRCFAVGSVGGVGGQQSLIEQWNGATWSTVAHADPVGATSSLLTAVACADASDCFAVGYSIIGAGQLETLTQRWNGTDWSVVPGPTGGAFALLNAVTCLGATSCYAVGKLGASEFTPLIERWDGSVWSTDPSPSVPGTNTELFGVACSQVSSCFAVGEKSTHSGDTPVIEQWDGTGWSFVAGPNAHGVSQLSGVACPTVTSCLAVGGSGSASASTAGLLEQWDGTRWSSSSPARGMSGSYNLHGVVCAGPSSCFAVGETRFGTVVLRWNGTQWSLAAAPNPDGKDFNRLAGVACISVTNCTAVGAHVYSSAALADRWDGAHWTGQASPSAGPPSDALAAVTCRSSTNCFAVGRTDTDVDGGYRTLIEHWNGAQWSITPSANLAVGLVANDLESVSCASATHCFAVGFTTYEALPTATFVQQWNGTTWSSVTLARPRDSHPYAVLAGVTCPTTNRCFAVGSYYGPKNTLPLVEQWNGKTWSQLDSPIAKKVLGSGLNGVSCAGASRCFGVGSQFAKGSATTTSVERWNGTTWTPSSSPNPGGSAGASLSAVSCATATNCVAVGSYHTNGTTRPLAERWDGTRWSLTTGLDPTGASSSQLASVACLSATNCTAVGSAVLGGTTTPLVERWNGRRWSFEVSPTTSGARSSSLSGVTCAPSGGCFAVGGAVINNGKANLIEHRS